jgi:hypothetical protein
MRWWPTQRGSAALIDAFKLVTQAAAAVATAFKISLRSTKGTNLLSALNLCQIKAI